MTKAKYFRELDKIYTDFNDNFKEVFDFKFNIPKTIESHKRYQELSIGLLEIEDEDNTNYIEHLKEEIDSLSTIPKIIYTMSLVYVISHFEVFLSKITSVMLTYFWQSLKTTEKNINYEQVLSFESIIDLRSFLIEKEVSKISRGSIKERISYLEKKLKLKFEYQRVKGVRGNWNSIEFESLIELHSTRNIIIHNNSIVNDIYLRENPKTGLKNGEKRIVDKEYALDGIFVLFRVSNSIYSVAKHKVKKKKTNNIKL